MKIRAYHCRNCGGITEPEERLCGYCGRLSKIGRFWGNLPKHKVRILSDVGNDYVYLDQIRDISTFTYEPNYIDETFMDIQRRYIRSSSQNSGKITVKMVLTERGVEHLDLIRKCKSAKTRFEILGVNKAFEVNTYPVIKLPEPAINEIQMIDVEFVVDGDIKEMDMVVHDCVSCPNCGAPVKSVYGACDYCGGWIEYF